MSDKYHDAVAQSCVLEDDVKVSAEVAKILADHMEENNTP